MDLKFYLPGPIAAEFHLQNDIGEELHGVWKDDGDVFQITRHRADYKTEEVREWIKANTTSGYHHGIEMYDPTVG